VLPAAAQHPDAGRIYPPDIGATMTSLWENRQTVHAALDQLPTTFTHNDLFPRNLRRRQVNGATQNVAIDWAFCGAAPVGAELAPLVGATVGFLCSSPDEWDEMERLCLDGYLRGLRAEGWKGSAEEVRLGYAASLVLRYGLGGLPAIVGLSMFTEDREIVRLAFGCSFEEFVENCAAATRFLCERVREISATLGI
jgi:Phosphotransferase enzyme family